MEIFTGNRHIRITSADLLAYKWEQALAAAAPEVREQLAQKFDARKAALTDPQVFDFEVAPLNFTDQWRAVDWARNNGLWNGDPETLSVFLLSMLNLLMNIRAWSGFQAGGRPLECNEDNKVLVFGQAAEVIQVLWHKLQEEREAEGKNSGTSQAGSSGSTPTPARPAGKFPAGSP